MTPVDQLPAARESGDTPEVHSLKPLILAIALGLLLLFQVGLVLWVYLKQW